MASAFTMSRVHLIYGLCLPLALLLGYVMAAPLESSSLAVMVFVVAVLITPLLMKWYHPVLVLAWNSTFYFPFMPGAPPAWVALSAIGFVFVLLNRCVDSKRRLMAGGFVAWALLALAVVAWVTAWATGGVGLAAIGSSTFGGRKYIYLGAAIIGSFVMTSQRIPKSRLTLYVALYFLSGMSTVLLEIANRTGIPPAFFLVSGETATAEVSQFDPNSVMRVTGLVNIAMAIWMFMLARYGIAGLLDLRRPWRLFLVGFFVLGGLYGGFRSFLGFVVLTGITTFFIEGLHRTKYMLTAILAGALCVAGLFAFSSKLPLSIQRSISFLPLDIHPTAAAAAKDSLDWRLDMWKEVSQDVPRYLFKGKGFVIDPTEMYFSHANSFQGFNLPSEWAIMAGDYHNGPLSVLIPFGLWGALAFGWFLFASVRLLHRYCREGDPELKLLNNLILASFIVRIFFFIFLVGGLTADLPCFVSLVGLAICVNGELPKRVRTEPDEVVAPQPAF